MYKINILGKNYTIHSSLPSSEINRIAKEINEKYKIFEIEYKTFDKVDILIFYLLELYEIIHNLRKSLSKEEEIKNKIKNKIEEIEKDIFLILENLTISE
ncbi:MAG: cell division protein ZapA [Candidatus Omnitrophica bacterium]|nr:cell division protein ZapA [Candidatus Omnitrophota bacterium]MCM8809903.1 cell division protein ZapA [Candidatus Omnitrophota bacterium]MCM8811356.1 cell division protein ZapA [Candidatus Omnitrophota bacterium]MCM8832816.1 cell division protein ZapA [Candidatus Omnitrophota bacterium]